MRMQAVFNGTVIADSDDTVVVEGNHYFPADSVAREHLTTSSTRSHCPWKGEAAYYTVEVDGERSPDAAWYYPQPSTAAQDIRDRVAFWRGVDVVPAGGGAR